MIAGIALCHPCPLSFQESHYDLLLSLLLGKTECAELQELLSCDLAYGCFMDQRSIDIVRIELWSCAHGTMLGDDSIAFAMSGTPCVSLYDGVVCLMRFIPCNRSRDDINRASIPIEID